VKRRYTSAPRATASSDDTSMMLASAFRAGVGLDRALRNALRLMRAMAASLARA
jgi:hypothetical protein